MMRRLSNHAAHVIFELFVGAAAMVALAGCALVWRLHTAPIDITQLAARLETRLPPGSPRLHVASAELAWEGFSRANSPLDIRWRDLTIGGADGSVLAHLPQGRVTLSLHHLLLGRAVPRVVELDGASINIARMPSGALNLQLAEAAPGAPPPAQASAGPDTDMQGGMAVLRGLMRPRQDLPPTPLTDLLAQLHRVTIRDAMVTLRDARLGLVWHAHASGHLTRQADGTLLTDAQLAMRVGNVDTTLTANGTLGPGGLEVTAATTPVVPYALALTAPVFAPLAAIDAPVTAAAMASFSPDLLLTSAVISLQAGQGYFNSGRGRAPIDSAAAVLRTDGHALDLSGLRVAFHRPPEASSAAPTVTGSAHASPAADGWQATVALDIPAASFADLPLYWPYGTGGGSRPWIAENITTGAIRGAHVSAGLHIDPVTGDTDLTTLSGGLTASGLTVHWLRPVPPVEDGTATLTLENPDALRVSITSGHQGALALTSGMVRITGLSAHHQIADITAALSGSLPDTLALLNHPRLNLLSRRPVSFTNPAGQLTGSLHMKLPLEDSVTMEQLGITAQSMLSGVHLGGIAAGRDLDAGRLALKVSADGMQVNGDATLAGVPSQLAVALDFRAGPPSQILTHVTATGRAQAAALQQAGLPDGILTGGSAALTADYTERRDGSATVALSTDLSAAALTTPLGWSKPAGPHATAAARILLQDGHMTGLDQLRAQGPDLAITSHADITAGRTAALVLDRVRVGRTDATGAITLARPGQALHIALHGPELDLSALLAQRDRAPPPPDNAPDTDATPGPPWSADLDFDQVILARDETLSPATATAESDGRHLRRLLVTAGTQGQVRVAITQAGTGRKLSVDSADAGAVLLAAGVANNIRGGRLRLTATYDDTAPHAPLSGDATLDNFRLTDAPGVGRLLQAMTLYGAVDLLRGPGLGFSKAIVPFSWHQRVLELKNARAFSASLGLTAAGSIDLRHRRMDVTGTIVPAYFFNQMLGNIPLLGLVFSPEKGGGVFAASYGLHGKLDNPQVGVNPLAALTPGILRGIFNLF